MLKSLSIKDYALIDSLNIEFGNGLNILTGETGAGKSILIGALGLLLGDRASTDVVRKGSKKSIVEGIFDVSKNKKVSRILEENELDSYEELIIRREISLKGSNRCFLNDTPVSLTLIKETGELLVDLHGQHEHQSLLRQDLHVEMLDEFCGLESDVADFNNELKKLHKLIRELNELLSREKELRERKEIIEFQLKEINEVDPVEGEEEHLNHELNVLDNAEHLIKVSEEIYSALYDDENSISDQLGKIRSAIEELNEIDNVFSDKFDEVENVISSINDIADFVRSYRDKIDLEPERLEEVRERLGAVNLLKKRYGGSIEQVLKLRDKISEELEIVDNFADKIEELNSSIKSIRNKAGNMADSLTSVREKNIPKLKKGVEEALNYLGFTSALFEVDLRRNEIDNGQQNYLSLGNKNYSLFKNGIDRVEFFLSANKGEDPKPLVKVASGGEVSRIMLALKTILAKNDKLPVLIFDEIDIGVSGRIAQKVGNALYELSKYHQLIVITHLPQIAGLADVHFSIVKSDIEKRTVTRVFRLTKEERVTEVAKLLSGEEITEAGLNSARELINSRE